MAGELILKNGLRVTGSIIATSFTGSILGTASFYNETDTLQSVVARGSFASSSANIILSANDSVQIRGQAGSSNATASLSFGVGTNANNYILAGKALNIQGNRSNTNNLGVTILSAEDSNQAARITVGSGSNASRIQLATTIYQNTGPVTNLEIEDQQTFIYGPLTIGDDDPNGIYGSLLVTGSSTFTGPLVNNGSTTLGSVISDITFITGSVLITGSSTLTGNLTVTGNTKLGNDSSDIVRLTGSLDIKGAGSTNSLKMTAASFFYGSTDEAINIRTSSSVFIPSVLLGTNTSKYLLIQGYNGNDATIHGYGLTSVGLDCDSGPVNLQANTLGDVISHGTFTVKDANLIISGSLIVTGSVIFSGLPTTEPATSGQLWMSGSAGASSRVLCVKI